jgi:dTDP-glucose 4,6-dehydratase
VNIGNPQEVTMLELAEAVQDAVGKHPGVQFHPRPVDDPTVRRPDTTLAESVLGWKAEVALTDGLVRTAEWFRAALPAA